MPYTYNFDVKMTCTGCSNAVDRVLAKAKVAGEVEDYQVDLGTQKVVVKSDLSLDDIEAKIKKTGKEVRSSVVVG